MRKYGSGPAGVEPIGLGHTSVRLPERILENVGDHNSLSAVHGRTARSCLRSDAKSIDGLAVGLGKAGGRAMPRVLSILVEEQDRAKQAGKLRLHNAHQVLQYVLQRSIARDHLQNAALSVTQRLRPLAFGDVNRATHELHQIPGCAHNRMANGVDISNGAGRKKDSEFHFVIRLFTYGSIDCGLPYGSILRMDALQPFLPSRHTRFWVEAVYPIPFLG